jgi:hypothetical protein
MPNVTVTREQGNFFESLTFPGFYEFIENPVEGLPLQTGCPGQFQILA